TLAAHTLAFTRAPARGGWAGRGVWHTTAPARPPGALPTSARASARSVEHSHPGFAPAPGVGGGPKNGILPVVLGYRYPRGAVIDADREQPVVPDGMDLDGRPGSRAPHMWLRRAGERLSTIDLYESSLVLLSDAPDDAGWHAAARRIADRDGVRLDAYRIGPGPDADLTYDTDADDWAQVHGTTADGAVLVRPDGFVAWRAQGAVPDPEAALSKVLAAVLRTG
ncbi:monooxygenase, partial [Streptomyces sp. NPDC058964]